MADPLISKGPKAPKVPQADGMKVKPMADGMKVRGLSADAPRATPAIPGVSPAVPSPRSDALRVAPTVSLSPTARPDAPKLPGTAMDAPRATPTVAPSSMAPVAPMKTLTDSVFPRPFVAPSTAGPAAAPRPDMAAPRVRQDSNYSNTRAPARTSLPRRNDLGQATTSQPAPFAPSPLIQRDAAMRTPTSFFPMKRTDNL